MGGSTPGNTSEARGLRSELTTETVEVRGIHRLHYESTVHSGTKQAGNVQVHLYMDFFPINIQSALHIPRFHICGFNKPQIEKSIFDLLLGIHRNEGPI